MGYKLTENDRQDIQILINLSKSILENQMKLAKLEADGLKQSVEYKSILECLKSTLSLENSIYTRIGANKYKITAILYEFNQIELLTFDTYIKEFLKLDISSLINARISSTLHQNVINNNKNYFDRNLQTAFLNRETNETFFVNPDDLIYLDVIIKTDMLNTILTFLNKEIYASSNNDIRTILIKMKYMLAFSYSGIEKSLIEHEYEVNPNLYLTAKAFANTKNIIDDIFKILQNNFLKILFEFAANELVNIRALNTAEEFSKAIILKVILKTALVLDEPIKTKSIKSQIENQHEQLNFQPSLGAKMILEMIDTLAEDRNIPQIITLRLKKEES